MQLGKGVLMKIVEIFKSIEGEGMRAGYVATFVRTFGCCCRCKYCDSMYANEVQPDQILMDLSVDEIVAECIKLKTPYVTLTGGEPLIQKDAKELICKLIQNGFYVNIETSGAVDIGPYKEYAHKHLPGELWNNLMFTVDYKSISSGCTDMMIKTNFSINLWDRDVVKFVVGSSKDLDQMKSMVKEIRKYSSCHIFVSPIFGDIEPKYIVEYLKDNDIFDVRMQLQIHKFIWNPDMKGV